jgi:hypothetical protein
MLYWKRGIRHSCLGLYLLEDCIYTCGISRLLAQILLGNAERSSELTLKQASCKAAMSKLSCRVQQDHAILDQYNASYNAYVRLDGPS